MLLGIFGPVTCLCSSAAQHNVLLRNILGFSVSLEQIMCSCINVKLAGLSIFGAI